MLAVAEDCDRWALYGSPEDCRTQSYRWECRVLNGQKSLTRASYHSSLGAGFSQEMRDVGRDASSSNTCFFAEAHLLQHMKKKSPLQMGKTVFFSKWFMKQGILQRKKSFLLASPACSFCSLLPFAQLPPASAVPFYNLIVPGMPAHPWWQVPSGTAFLYFSVLLICIFKCFLFPLSISSSLSTSPNTHTLWNWPSTQIFFFFFCPKFHTCIFQ